jgi:PAS domain S-box-containing protein
MRQLQLRQLELEMENEALRDLVSDLRQRDQWTDQILESVPEGMLVVDPRGRVVRANRAAHEIFGYPGGSMPGMSVDALMPERYRAGHADRLAQFMGAPQSRPMGQGRDLRGLRRDGAEFPCEMGLAPVGMGERSFIVVSVADISKRKRIEEDAHIAAIAFESQAGMLVTDAQGTIVRVNRAFTRLTGYSAAEAIGQTPRLLSSGRHAPEFYREMWTAINERGHWQGQIWNRRRNGRIFAEWLTITAVSSPSGDVTHYVSTFSDITDNAEAEAQIHRLAYYDALTGLPNRVLLRDRLGQALAATCRSALHGAVLFIDLDNFKTVNDTRGHDIGDRLLVEVARRLLRAVRESDTVARLGGDEFVVILGTRRQGRRRRRAGETGWREAVRRPGRAIFPRRTRYPLHRQRRNLPVLRRGNGRRHPQARRPRHVSRQGRRTQCAALLRPCHAGQARRAQRSGSRTAQGAPARAVAALLPAANRCPGPDSRRGIVVALAASAARGDRTGGLHSIGGGVRADPAHRRMGAGNRLRTTGRMVGE